MVTNIKDINKIGPVKGCVVYNHRCILPTNLIRGSHNILSPVLIISSKIKSSVVDYEKPNTILSCVSALDERQDVRSGYKSSSRGVVGETSLLWIK
jgi:hypothetical protein